MTRSTCAPAVSRRGTSARSCDRSASSGRSALRRCAARAASHPHQEDDDGKQNQQHGAGTRAGIRAVPLETRISDPGSASRADSRHDRSGALHPLRESRPRPMTGQPTSCSTTPSHVTCTARASPSVRAAVRDGDQRRAARSPDRSRTALARRRNRSRRRERIRECLQNRWPSPPAWHSEMPRAWTYP